jgi:hypothetical protein
MRAEFAAIAAAMAKLAGYTGNGSKFLRVNAGGTAYEALTVADALAALAPSSAALATALTDTTGTGVFVRTQAPTLTSAVMVTPALGTPASGVLTNCTGTAAGLTAGNVTTNANLTGHITSTGNAAVLGSFTSAQLAAALTDETGSGAAVFATSPTLVTPALGTPSSGNLANCTFGAVAATSVTSTGGVQGIRRKALTFTRLSSAATGNVSYTGSGFLPRKGTLIIGLTSGQLYWSNFSFSADSSVGLQSNGITVGAASVTGQSGANPVIGNYFEGSASNYVQASLASFDSDGITITWTKVGSPVGTFTCWLLLEE